MKEALRLNQISEYYFVAKLAEIEQLNSSSELKVLNLGIGSPDLSPSETVLETLKHGMDEPGAHAYQSYRGTSLLRNAIAAWYKDWFDVYLLPDSQILPLMGSKEGIMHISMAFVNPGDKVLTPNPGYPSYRSCTLLAGGIPVEMPLKATNQWRPDFDILCKQDLSNLKLIWLNYPNMPTGAKADLGFFREAVAFARAHNAILCHDNPYVFLLNDQPLSALQADDSLENVLELTSLSKCYNMAGWRVGSVCGHRDHISAIMAFRSQMDSGMLKPVQQAAAKALASDRHWTYQLNSTYTRRQQIGYKIMEALHLETARNASGLFLWGKVATPDINGEQLSNALLQQASIFITPGHIFGSEGDQYLRLSLCSPESDLEAALYRIQTMFHLESEQSTTY